jgi:hypothetical protein
MSKSERGDRAQPDKFRIERHYDADGGVVGQHLVRRNPSDKNEGKAGYERHPGLGRWVPKSRYTCDC